MHFMFVYFDYEKKHGITIIITIVVSITVYNLYFYCNRMQATVILNNWVYRKQLCKIVVG